MACYETNTTLHHLHYFTSKKGGPAQAWFAPVSFSLWHPSWLVRDCSWLLLRFPFAFFLLIPLLLCLLYAWLRLLASVSLLALLAEGLFEGVPSESMSSESSNSGKGSPNFLLGLDIRLLCLVAVQ